MHKSKLSMKKPLENASMPLERNGWGIYPTTLECFLIISLEQTLFLKLRAPTKAFAGA